MDENTEVHWRWAQEGFLLLVHRPLYNVYALMTEEEFIQTEPYVEPVAMIQREHTLLLFRGHDKDDHEYYHHLGRPMEDDSAAIIIPKRKSKDVEDQ
jgi:hypothetical protein